MNDEEPTRPMPIPGAEDGSGGEDGSGDEIHENDEQTGGGDPLDQAALDQAALDRLSGGFGAPDQDRSPPGDVPAEHASSDEEAALAALSSPGDIAGLVGASDAGGEQLDPADPAIRAELDEAVPTGKGADVELALANVKDASRHRRLRDRALVAGGVAAALLLVVFGVSVTRSGGVADLETAGETTTVATNARPRPSTAGDNTYVGDPGQDPTGTTTAPLEAGTTVIDASTSSTATGASSTSSTQGPNPTPKPNDPPVLQLSIHAESSSVKAGDRAWFTVQVHNSGGEGTYGVNDCTGPVFGFTLTPNRTYGSSASWSGAPADFAAAVSQAGGGNARGPIAWGPYVGALQHDVACTLQLEQRSIASGATVSEKIAVDFAPGPGQQVAATYSASVEFTVMPKGGDPARATEVKASDSTTVNVTGSVPAFPGNAALVSVANHPAVSGWVTATPSPFATQTRYYRGAWEILLAPQQTATSSEILRIRLDSAGTLIDVRAVRNGSATSDDPGATAPVNGERKLYP